MTEYLGEFELNKIYCMDCLEGLKKIPDNSVDLVLTDPPYGIGADKGSGHYGHTAQRNYNDNWDNETPSKEYFDELLRIGKIVIIFGGNYFTDKLPIGTHWIVWDKINNIKFDNPFSDCELLWTNINRKSVKKYICIQQGFVKDNDLNNQRVHPTQKPLKLIREIIKDYMQEDGVVLDAFMGSGTTAVACKQLGRKFIGFEISPEYCKIAEKRLAQEVLF